MTIILSTYIVDKGDSLLLGTKNGLWLFDKENKIFSKTELQRRRMHSILNGDIKKIFLHSNHVWVWVDQQLVKVNADYGHRSAS